MVDWQGLDKHHTTMVVLEVVERKSNPNPSTSVGSLAARIGSRRVDKALETGPTSLRRPVLSL